MEVNIDRIKQNKRIIGTDPMLDQAISTAVQVAKINISVLVIGESGTGKEAISQIIHENSQRKTKPFVVVNCGAIPEGTIDSELFGHEKGAFTGATFERKGHFETADTGTIFLDEVGELPMATQAKLLRVLEKGEYMKVGSSVVRKTNVRVVAATNVDLEQAIAQGKFREDLFYRLNGVMIRIPPLRNRKQDIPALFRQFTDEFAMQNNISPVKLTKSAEQMLMAYEWPGNVRQLKNVAEQVTILTIDRIVDENEIEKFIPHRHAETSVMATDVNHQHSYSSEREILFKVLFDMRKDVTDLKKLVVELLNNGHGDASVSPENAQILKRLYQTEDGSVLSAAMTDIAETPISGDGYLHEVMPGRNVNIESAGKVTEVTTDVSEEAVYSISDSEKELIKRALEKYSGHRGKAAKELGISERTLYRKIRDYEIDIK